MDPALLSPTAHWNSYARARHGFEEASHFATPQGRRLYALSNLLALPGRPFGLGNPLEKILVPRSRMIDKLARESGARQFLDLASGLSPRGAAFAKDPSVFYVEADLPHVVTLKERLVRERIGGRPNHRFVAFDILNDDFASVEGFRAGEPLTVLSEGFSGYYEEAPYARVLERIAAFLRARGGGCYITDFTDGALQRGLGAWGAYFFALNGLLARAKRRFYAEDAEDVRKMFLRAGFAAAEATSSSACGPEWGFQADKSRDWARVWRAEA